MRILSIVKKGFFDIVCRNINGLVDIQFRLLMTDTDSQILMNDIDSFLLMKDTDSQMKLIDVDTFLLMMDTDSTVTHFFVFAIFDMCSVIDKENFGEVIAF